MNRLQYWIKAKTQYNIHSPFVFELYNDVLFAHIDKKTKKEFQLQNTYSQTIFKLKKHYHLEIIHSDARQTLLGNPKFGEVLVVDSPHRDKVCETEWECLKAQSQYRVSIDTYNVGLLFSSHKLHPQAFILR